MDGLIEALTILRKYDNPAFPTHCEHDALYICVNPYEVSTEDIERLEELHVHADRGEYCFYSYWYGSS